MRPHERIPEHGHTNRDDGGKLRNSAFFNGAAGAGGGGVANVPPLSEVLEVGNAAQNRAILGGTTFELRLAGGDSDIGDAGISLAPGGGAEGVGGNAYMDAGASGVGDAGGQVQIGGGAGDDGNDPGASVTIGGGTGSGDQGNVTISARHIILPGLPTADPGIPGALWVDGSNFLKVSP